MEKFTYVAMPTRVVFGAGSVSQLAAEVARLGAKRALLISTPGRAEMVRSVAKGLSVAGLFDKAVMHTPIAAVEAARAMAKSVEADCCVAVGGGSTVGLGKAIALESSLPIIAVPTTYAGSEMTPIYGLTEGRLKRTGRDMRVLPRTVIYDASLTLSLPASISAASGINAMAHAVEALYAEDANPVISLMAEEAIRALGEALPAIVRAPDDATARSRALYGAWLAGTCLGAVGMALHHKLCHTLGGTFNLPHAQTHAAMLPHTAHYNHAAAPAALARVARALGGKQAADAGPLLFELNRALGIPTALAQIGMPEQGLDEAADLACKNPYANPRPVERDAIRALLQRAWQGAEPA
jgi:alcohol dehydrogenase class IV